MIILKSNIRKMFEDAGLGEFTIARNNTGNLSLVGPCGKELIAITNFPVGTKLSKEERTIAIEEYITPMLTEHSATIRELILAKEAETNTTVRLDNIMADLKKDHYIVSADKRGYNGKALDFNTSIKTNSKDPEYSLQIQHLNADSGKHEQSVEFSGKSKEALLHAHNRTSEMILLLDTITVTKLTLLADVKLVENVTKRLVKECSI